MSKLSSRSMSLNNSIKKLGMNNSYCCRQNMSVRQSVKSYISNKTDNQTDNQTDNKSDNKSDHSTNHKYTLDLNKHEQWKLQKYSKEM